MPRLLRWINMAIALVAAVTLGLVYWFAWRPLPRTSGSVEAPVGREVSIARDAMGVPHITAATLEDAIFAQGYVTAQDRLWQMDALRRLAAGEPIATESLRVQDHEALTAQLHERVAQLMADS